MGSLAALHAMWFWVWPTLEQLGLVLLMGLFSAIGQTCMAKGLKAGEASVVIPFEYSRLLYAGLFGYLIFAEVPGHYNLDWSRYLSSAVHCILRFAKHV